MFLVYFGPLFTNTKKTYTTHRLRSRYARVDNHVCTVCNSVTHEYIIIWSRASLKYILPKLHTSIVNQPVEFCLFYYYIHFLFTFCIISLYRVVYMVYIMITIFITPYHLHILVHYVVRKFAWPPNSAASKCLSKTNVA